MKATKQIDIYLIQKRNVRAIDVVQYDTGVQLVFTVKDFDIPSGATAALYVQKPSGKFVLQEDGISVAGNTITIDLENHAITEHGKAPYQVSLKSGSDVITTFTGLIMVEKSLKDSGATESKTVIRAFDEAVSDHVAEFQTKAEQIVQACIATIPEDYTVMEAKVNNLANAVKGYLSGAVVFADDVSPVDHNPVVKAKSKNMATFGGSGEKNGLTYSCVDGVWTISGTPSIAYGGIQSRDITGLLEDGETYTISQSKNFASSSADGAMYLQIIAERHDGTQSFIISAVGDRTFTVDKQQYKTYVMSLQAGTALSPVSLTGFTVQLEKGSKATEHTPYVDPSTVTVKRYGKNLVTITEGMTTESNGVTFTTKGTGGISVSGTPTGISRLALYGGGAIVKSGMITLSLSGSYTNIVPDFQLLDDSGAIVKHIQTGSCVTLNLNEYPDVTSWNIAIKRAENNVSCSGTVYIQIEYGSKATAFEKAVATTHIPATDGTVPGVTSISPNMTILTDTEGVIVECEYNRDTNKVIDKLIKAITALGGTV